MIIADLTPNDQTAIHELATLLMESFRENWPEAWPDLESALEEVHESLGGDRISRILIDDNHQILGWIGGICQYNGYVWELHPLVVHPRYRGQGLGRLLVADLEQQVRDRGGLTLWVGTDDEADMTSLAGQDLYPDVLAKLASIQNLRGHPYEFYQKVGFTIVGVMPDANGLGKPDIYLAKRVGSGMPSPQELAG